MNNTSVYFAQLRTATHYNPSDLFTCRKVRMRKEWSEK